MGSLIGQGIEYDVKGRRGGGGKETLRGQQQIPSKNRPKYPYCPFEPPPPQECIELHVQEWSDRSNVFPLVLLLSP